MVNATSLTKIHLSFMKEEITKEEAINQLMTIVLKNPAYFGLEKLSKEKLQDFIFYSINKINNIFKNYDSSKASFSTYFQLTIRYSFETWKRTMSQISAKNKVYKKMNYFVDNEKVFTSQHNIDSYIAEKDEVYFPTKNKKRKKQLSDFELLVIALKSSYYISNEQIEKIMNNSNLNRISLTSYIKELNEKLIKKICIKNNLEMAINEDFMKMEVLKINYENFKFSKPEKAELIKKKYISIKNRRSKRLNRFKKIKIVPSDIEISKLLNVTPSKIRYVLTKNFELYNIKEQNPKVN